MIVSTGDSRTRAMRESAQQYLAAYGLPIAAQTIRMLCAGYKTDPKDKVSFIPSTDSKDQATPPRIPYVFHTDGGGDPEVASNIAENLQALFLDVYAAPLTSIKSAGETPVHTKLKLARAQVDQLRTAIGADYIWAIDTSSAEVSTGKVVASAFLTALLTLGMGAGAPHGGTSNTIALVDLRYGSIAWKKVDGTLGGLTTMMATGVRSQPYETTSSGSSAALDWSAALFAPFLAPAQGLVSNNTVTIPPAAQAAEPAATSANAHESSTAPTQTSATSTTPASATPTAAVPSASAAH